MSAVLVQAASKRQPITARELRNHWLLERGIVREPIREQNNFNPIGEQENEKHPIGTDHVCLLFSSV